MTDLKDTLIGHIKDNYDVGDGSTGAAAVLVDDFMSHVKTAIEVPGTSADIDAWLVRTALGKEGTRRDDAVARAIGAGEDPETRTVVYLYARIYALERQAGGSVIDASKAAQFACGVLAVFVHAHEELLNGEV